MSKPQHTGGVKTIEEICEVIGYQQAKDGTWWEDDWLYDVTDKVAQLEALITDHTNKQIAKARRSERLEVALDNYRGQTFSESTDYKSKFDKFVRNNELRIEQLSLKEHKEKL